MPGNDTVPCPGEVRDASAIDWDAAIVEAESFAKGRGKLPAAIQKLVDAIKKPRTDWRHLFRRTARAALAIASTTAIP